MAVLDSKSEDTTTTWEKKEERGNLFLKHGTAIDRADMKRVGKVQEFKVDIWSGPEDNECYPDIQRLQRNFRLISILGFTAVLMCTWEAILL